MLLPRVASVRPHGEMLPLEPVTEAMIVRGELPLTEPPLLPELQILGRDGFEGVETVFQTA